MYFEIKGILDFEPENKTKKHLSQAAWKKHAVILTDCDTHLYYAWFLKKRFNLELIRPLRGCHVTLIADKVDNKIFEQAAKQFHGKSISFEYENDPRSNGEHWWLRVKCPQGEAIREVMGLSPKPFWSFHLSLGLIKESERSQSEYIIRQRIKFDI